ncbi:hypothetical protein BJX99DRAFT_261825, partial [Aspergillus californicus]
MLPLLSVLFAFPAAASLSQEQPFSSTANLKRQNSLSEKASLDEPLLAVQIGGIVGAYVIFVAIIVTLLLVVGRRLRRTVQASNYTLQVEMMKPKAPITTTTAASTTDPSPVTPTNKSHGFRSWASLTKGNHSRTSNNGSAGTIDHESVVAADRRRAQDDMEMLYAAVMAHDERRAAASTSPISPADDVSLQELAPRSPMSYQSAHPNPFSDYAARVPEPQFQPHHYQQPQPVKVAPAAIPTPTSPRPPSSRLSRISNLSLFNSNSNAEPGRNSPGASKIRSPRFPIRKLPISAPMRSPDPISPNSDQIPLSP